MEKTHPSLPSNSIPERGLKPQNHKIVNVPPVLIPYLETTGFANVAKLKEITIDTSFIYALLERRPETHTFHFPTDECTITLEYVSMLLGLRVNGRATV